jgi:hypothetical protein
LWPCCCNQASKQTLSTNLSRNILKQGPPSIWPQKLWCPWESILKYSQSILKSMQNSYFDPIFWVANRWILVCILSTRLCYCSYCNGIHCHLKGSV